MRGYSDNLCFSRAVGTILHVVRPGLEKKLPVSAEGGVASPSAGTGESIVPPPSVSPLFVVQLPPNLV